MLGSVGGVFSASEFGNLGFEVDFRLEENDLGRRFLIDEDMVLDEEENNVEIENNVIAEREKERENWEREREKIMENGVIFKLWIKKVKLSVVKEGDHEKLEFKLRWPLQMNNVKWLDYPLLQQLNSFFIWINSLQNFLILSYNKKKKIIRKNLCTLIYYMIFVSLNYKNKTYVLILLIIINLHNYELLDSNANKTFNLIISTFSNWNEIYDKN